MKIGERIARWLEYAGLTQVQLAAKLGIVPSAVTNWVTEQNDPATSRLPAIAEALGLDLATFFGPIPKKREEETEAAS